MTQDKANSESWTYVQPTKVLHPISQRDCRPTGVYQGPDAQFDGIDSADRVQYAASVITDELRSELAKPSRLRPSRKPTRFG